MQEVPLESVPGASVRGAAAPGDDWKVIGETAAAEGAVVAAARDLFRVYCLVNQPAKWQSHGQLAAWAALKRPRRESAVMRECHLCGEWFGDRTNHACNVRDVVRSAVVAERQRLAAIMREVARGEMGWGTDPAELLCQVADRVEAEDEPEAETK